MGSLSGQTVLVVGGSSGLGFAVAKAALREGGRVIIASSNEKKVAAAIEQLGGGQNLTGSAVDLKTEGGVKTFFEKHGAVDHLVYTAGDSVVQHQFPEANIDDSRGLFEVRYWGVLNFAKFASTYIRSSITLTSGMSYKRPIKGWSLVAPVVGVIPALVRSLALDLAPLRVNAIVPGLIKTEMWDFMEESGRKAFFDASAEKLPVKHVADADEIAGAYIFALNCKYLTGQSLKLDGGSSLV